MASSLPESNEEVTDSPCISSPTEIRPEDTEVPTEAPDNTTCLSNAEPDAHSQLPSNTIAAYSTSSPSSPIRANRPRRSSHVRSTVSNVEIPYSRFHINTAPTALASSAPPAQFAMRLTQHLSPLASETNSYYTIGHSTPPARSLLRGPDSFRHRLVWVTCSHVSCWVTRPASGVQNRAWLCQKHYSELREKVAEMFLDWYSEDSDA